MGGYAGAKAKCEGVATCSASAHLCGGEGVVRSLALGIDLALALNAWFHGQGTVGAGVPVVNTSNDCNGFTQGVAGGSPSSFYGSVFSVSVENNVGASIYMVACEAALPLLCCD